METNARRALSELIDQLVQPSVPQPAAAVEPIAVEPPATTHLPAPAQALASYGIQVQPDHPVRPVPAQRPAEPAQPVPAALTVLPGGARSAIMWRSR